MPGRIRRQSGSTSASTPRAGLSRYNLVDEQPLRSDSGTPVFEDDEEGGRKRSTRGRNPLPPSSGPLFPPLPPKVTKSRISGNSFSGDLGEAIELSPAPSEKPDLPSISNASLTPPPPGSEDVLLDEEEEEVQENGDDEEGTKINGDEAVKPKIEIEEAAESLLIEEERTRNGSERAGSHSRAKRRRGEEALLLDDHLLPPEIRHISQPAASRRSSNAKGDLEEEKRKKEPPVEDVVMDDEAAVDGEEELDDVEIEEEEGEGAEVEGDDDDEDEGQDITRCVCQIDDPDNSAMMISCDKCNVWQHGPCMGIWGDDDAPDEYYCELCRPDLHGPLKRWIRRCGRDIAMFVPPTYDDLRAMRPHGDKSAPSQSTFFTDPARNTSPSPPPPSKPASRSHHKKEVDPPAPNDGRRSGRRLPFPERPPSQTLDPQPAVKAPALAKRKSSAGKIESVSPNRSLSPSAHMHSAARRRITMNSRDAQYEEEVKAAMEASRREALGLSPAAEVAPEVAVEEEEAEKTETKKGKRKRDEEEASGDGPNSKAKHPNQYTYRPKPPSSSQPAAPAAPSPVRRAAGGTPAPPSIAPPQHEHGTRRAGAIAHGAIANPTLSATSVANLNWYLPDHLTAYSDLLPTTQPNALDVRSQTTLPHISRNHHLNQRYGPFSNERDENGKLILPDEIPMREPAGEAETHLEPPARVRYPAKRITVGEIRKRVRNMMDYVSKAQSGEEKRLERNRILGIKVTPLPKKGKGKEKADQNENEDPVANGDSMDIDEPCGSGSREADILGDIDINQMGTQEDEPAPRQKTASEMMEEFTRDLIAFQETYLSNTSATPLPPPASNFEPSLPIPGLDVEVESRAVSEAGLEPEAEVEPETEAPTDLELETTADLGEEAVDEAQDLDETEAEADERQVQQDGLEALASEEVQMILDDREPLPEAESDSDYRAQHDPVTTADESVSGDAEAVDTIPASVFEIPIAEVSTTGLESEPEVVPVSSFGSAEEPTTEFDAQDQSDNEDIGMDTTEGLEVYREGQVDMVEITMPEEVDVVEDHGYVGVEEVGVEGSYDDEEVDDHDHEEVEEAGVGEGYDDEEGYDDGEGYDGEEVEEVDLVGNHDDVEVEEEVGEMEPEHEQEGAEEEHEQEEDLAEDEAGPGLVDEIHDPDLGEEVTDYNEVDEEPREATPQLEDDVNQAVKPAVVEPVV